MPPRALTDVRACHGATTFLHQRPGSDHAASTAVYCLVSTVLLLQITGLPAGEYPWRIQLGEF
jgi:hypothetical protein